MIKAVQEKILDSTCRIIQESWNGDATELMKYADPSFSLLAVDSSELLSDRDQITELIRSHKGKSIEIGRQQYDIPYNRKDLCIVTGRYHISINEGTRQIIDTHWMSAVWYRQNKVPMLIQLSVGGFHPAQQQASADKETKAGHVVFTDREGQTWALRPDDILYVRADRNYVWVYSISVKPLQVRSTIAGFALKLPKQFEMVGRSYCVNKSHIMVVKEDAIVMDNGQEIPISRRMQLRVRKMLYS